MSNNAQPGAGQGAQIFEELRNRIGDPTFGAWFGEVEILVEAEGPVSFMFPTKFAAERVKGEHGTAIDRAVAAVLKRKADVLYLHGKRAEKASKGALRKVEDDDQPDFFAPLIHDVPLKDDFHLLAIAPFTLTNRVKQTKLLYTNVNGMTITLTAPEENGILTSNDYDVIVMMMSELNELANRWRYQMADWRAGGEVGPMPEKPPRVMRTTIKDIEQFKKADFGGRQYKAVEDMLDRLANTHCKIARVGRQFRRAGNFNFLSHYVVESRAKSGAVTAMQLGYPDWIYNGIVRENAPTLGTISPDYVRIEKPLGKFLYRLAKNEAREGEAELPLKEVYQRGPTHQVQKEFNRELTDYVSELQASQASELAFPEYTFAIEGPPRARVLKMCYVGSSGAAKVIEGSAVEVASA